jgi:OmpA-OmpF porin, OOP family
MNHRNFARAPVLAAMFAGGVAHAEDAGFYLGASVGEASQDAGEFDGSDTSFKLFGGYSFNQYFAAEAGYVDGGEQTDSIDSLDFAVKSDGFFAAALAKLPIGDYVAPYVKLGYVFYDSTTTVSDGSAQLSEDSSDEDLLYGLGLEFKLGEHFRLRAEYEQVDLSDADFDIISVVAAYRF